MIDEIFEEFQKHVIGAHLREYEYSGTGINNPVATITWENNDYFISINHFGDSMGIQINENSGHQVNRNTVRPVGFKTVNFLNIFEEKYLTFDNKTIDYSPSRVVSIILHIITPAPPATQA